jgi:prepilin-type processing-associated H-X9-DG protein
MGTPHPLFFCPTRREPTTVAFSFPGFFNNKTITIAQCDYAASNWELTGVVRQFFPVRITDISDGTSNTLLLGDKRLNLAHLGQAQYDDDVGYASGWDNDTIRETERPPLPDFSRKKGDGDWRFGSSHPGLFNIVLADGSVRPVDYTIDPNVFRYLGDKADGQVINPNDF